MDVNGWNEKRQKQCEEIGDRAGAYIWLCNESCNYYSKVQTLLTLVISISTFVLGSTGIPTLFTTTWSGAKYFNLVIQILIIAMGIFGVVNKNLDYTEKVRKYVSLAEKNTYFFLKIRKELVKDQVSRQNFTDFYEQIDAEEKDIRKTYVKIPDWVFQRYTKKMGAQALKYGDLFGDRVNM